MKSYRRFLAEAEFNLIEILRVLENEQWHHEPLGEKASTYVRVTRVLQELNERKEWADDNDGPEAPALRRAGDPEA